MKKEKTQVFAQKSRTDEPLCKPAGILSTYQKATAYYESHWRDMQGKTIVKMDHGR